jgi:hypothetical protein
VKILPHFSTKFYIMRKRESYQVAAVNKLIGIQVAQREAGEAGEAGGEDYAI